MGQYHKLVNMTATQWLCCYQLGCGLKAWEQSGGGKAAALAFLLAHKPGNMPGDLGHHPMAGRWAGNRLLVVGDYAEDSDIKKFGSPKLSKVYELCNDMPELKDFTAFTSTRDFKTTVVSPEKQFSVAMKEWDKLTKKNAPFEDISRQVRGAVEFAQSVRFCGNRTWLTDVPVKPFAVRGEDGHLHYVLSNVVTRDRETTAYIGRMLDLGGRKGGKIFDPSCLPAGMDRWPWDRPPADLSWHNATDGIADDGQARVFANLDAREYYDPMSFGEQPTTVGIMRVASWGGAARMAMDVVISADGVRSNVKEGTRDFGSASALFAMLLHPHTRGGGDISNEDFPEVGRWRNSRLLLTSEMESDLPSTSKVKASFRNISDEVLTSLTKLATAA